MAKEIWLPKSETTATVTPEGQVSVSTSMVMEAKKIETPTGFGKGLPPASLPHVIGKRGLGAGACNGDR